jgi:hypothetical protein
MKETTSERIPRSTSSYDLNNSSNNNNNNNNNNNRNERIRGSLLHLLASSPHVSALMGPFTFGQSNNNNNNNSNFFLPGLFPSSP